MKVDDPDAAQFAAFVERNARWIGKLSAGHARRFRVEFDDARQDFFVWLLKRWKAYDPARGAESTYLALEARSLADFAERTRRARKRCGHALSLDGDETGAPADRAPSPPDLCAAREGRAVVRAAVDALPARLRCVVHGQMGFGGEHLSHRALGERLGLSRSRVQQLAESAFEVLLDQHFAAVAAARDVLL
ncbi:MAG: sigma-70 family RNA polymerase sigma factor [Planctomycetes bacterium]|nr:sigma-70 family RNA polymerase sigma factor [Planctomycetota bacterium]